MSDWDNVYNDCKDYYFENSARKCNHKNNSSFYDECSVESCPKMSNNGMIEIKCTCGDWNNNVVYKEGHFMCMSCGSTYYF